MSIKKTDDTFGAGLEFILEGTDFPMPKDREEWRLCLRKIFEQLLCNDFEQLLRIMYRADVGEEGFRQSMKGPSVGVIAMNISNLLIDRETEKVHFRNKIKGDFKDDFL